MEGRVDFSALDRSRLLGTLPSGSLGHLFAAGGEPSTSSALSRLSAASAAAAAASAGVSPPDLPRPGSPSALQQYVGRFLPGGGLHTSGAASYAMMANYLASTGHIPDSLKHLMPEFQQYWASAQSEGYARYLLNNIYYPYLPYLPATDTLSLFAQNSANAQLHAALQGQGHHRIYDLQKESIFNPSAVPRGFYPPHLFPAGGQLEATNLSLPSSSKSRPPEREKDGDQDIKDEDRKESSSRDKELHSPDRRGGTDTDRDRQSAFEKNRTKMAPTQQKTAKGYPSKTDDKDKIKSSCKTTRTDKYSPNPNQCNINSSKSIASSSNSRLFVDVDTIPSTDSETKVIKDMIDTACRERDRKRSEHSEAWLKHSPLVSPTRHERVVSPDRRSAKAYSPVSKKHSPSQPDVSTVHVQDVPENLCMKDKKRTKSGDVKSDTALTKEHIRTQSVVTGTTITVTSTQNVFTSEQTRSEISLDIHHGKGQISPGSQVSPSSRKTTSTTYSLPYYHNLYSRSTPDGKKVHAVTYIPEIGTISSPIAGAPSVINVIDNNKARDNIQALNLSSPVSRLKSGIDSESREQDISCRKDKSVSDNETDKNEIDVINIDVDEVCDFSKKKPVETPKDISEFEKCDKSVQDTPQNVNKPNGQNKNGADKSCSLNEKGLVSDPDIIDVDKLDDDELVSDSNKCDLTDNSQARKVKDEKSVIKKSHSVESCDDKQKSSASDININKTISKSDGSKDSEAKSKQSCDVNHNSKSKNKSNESSIKSHKQSPLSLSSHSTAKSTTSLTTSAIDLSKSVSNNKVSHFGNTKDKQPNNGKSSTIRDDNKTVVKKQTSPVKPIIARTRTTETNSNDNDSPHGSQSVSSPPRNSDQTYKVSVSKHQESQQQSQGQTIPVGIAVARQRNIAPKVSGSNDKEGRKPADDSRSKSQSADVKPIRPLKIIRPSTKGSSTTVGEKRNELPANLIVTGGSATPGVFWPDDPASRQLAAQVLQNTHPLTPTTWYSPTQFSLPQGIVTTTSEGNQGNQLPLTVPPGFKLAQDSLTGQILLIPTGGDVYDPSRVFGYPLGTQLHQGSTFVPPVITGQQTSSPLPTTPTLFPGQHGISDRPATLDFTVPQFPQIYNASVLPGSEVAIKLDKADLPPHQTTSSVVAPPVIIQNGQEGAAVATNINTDRENEKDKIQPAVVTDISIATGQTLTFPSSNVPFLFNSNSLLTTQTVPEPNPDINLLKQEQTTVQSRGTSPMLPATDSSAEDNEDCSGIADVKSGCESEDIVETIPSSDDKLQCDGKSTVIEYDLSTENEDVESGSEKCKARTDVFVDSCDSSEQDSNLTDKKGRNDTQIVDLSDKQSQINDTQSLKSGDLKDNVIKIQSDLVTTNKTISELKKEPTSSCGAKSMKSDRNIFTDLTDYNPFTDPHVLQAADGLELLSALAVAEKSSLKPNTDDKDDDDKPLSVTCDNENKDDVYTFKDDQNTILSKSDKKPILNMPGLDKAKHLVDKSSEPGSLSEKTKSRVRCGHAFKPRKKEEVTPTSPSPKRMMTFCGITIPEDDDVIDSIEMEMKMRLAELQRRYREKQRELAKLTPKRDKDSDKDTEKATTSSDKSVESKRGPGRPKKRKHDSGDTQETARLKGPKKEGNSGNTSQSGHHKPHGLNKKKRMAELLVDRVFRKTGSSFKIPLSKKVSLIAPARIEFPCTATCTGSERSDRPETAHHNKPIDFGKLIKRSRFSQFGGKDRGFVGGIWHKKDERKKQKHSLFHSASLKKKKREKSVSVENGLGLLAEYAAKSQESHNKTSGESSGKRKSADNFSNVPSPESPNKKRKPGRPKKCDVIRPGITETIVAKQSKHIDFFRWQTEARKEEPKQERKISLEGKTPLKPLYLDEWNVRRSERIFLNDPSPQTSPNAVSPDGKTKKDEKTKDAKKEEIRRPEQPKKSRSVNLSQKVKKKYSAVMTQQKSKYKTEQLKASRDQLTQKRKEQKKQRLSSGQGRGSDSEADDMPLSSYKPPQKYQATPNCVIGKDELQDEMRILVFMEGLFHEGELKAIRPPDIYGAILDNERKTRPHYFSQEEILKDAIKDVKATSTTQLKEGTRICAYWSQQFSCLYPGTISRGSPNPDDGKEDLLNVEFDDGDTGRIPLDHIRIIPQDFPLVEYDPNPLLFLTKRRRTVSVSESSEPRKSVASDTPGPAPISSQQAKDKPKRGPGRPPKVDRLLSSESMGGDDVFVSEKKKSETKESSSTKVEDDDDDNEDEEEEDDDDDSEVLAPTPRGLWSWSGSPTKRPGLKGKAKKEYYKTIVRGRETISVGESAVFLSIGRPNLPYVGRIESLWESWGGHMTVKVKWFYHPEETKGGKRLQNMKGALFRSDHEDDNDVQTISHKCDVIPYAEYRRRKDVISLDDNEDVYYMAGSYQPTIGHITFEPGVMCN